MSSSNQTELRSWQKRLDILQQENVLLKNKVTELIKEGTDTLVLEKIEFYLSIFLDKDTILALLRHEVAGLQHEIDRNFEPQVQHAVDAKKERLRQDIGKMELEFYKLKTEFTDYIARSAAPTT